MINPELLSLDFTAQIQLVKSGQVSASEILSQQQALIAKLNPSLNAFISYEKAAFPEQQDTPLAGLSIALKDNIDALGFFTTAGMATRMGRVPSEDAFVTHLLRQAGASFIGKLNMHEGALGATNYNSHFGNCHNPFQPGLTPGGSSGGSAVSVASGMASMSLGTDTMGSVRIPASYCGIFGFKPSRGAVSNRGTVTCSRIMDNIGPMARSVDDLILVMNIIAKHDGESAESCAYLWRNVTELTPGSVLLVPDNLSGLGINRDIIDDFNANLDIFRQIGCSIQTFCFTDYDFAAARRAGLLLCEADMRQEHKEDWQNNRDTFSDYMQAMLGFVDTKSPVDIMRAERVLENAVVFANRLFSQGDFLLMPTAPQRAFSFDEEVPVNQADLTSFSNQAGLAALSLPMQTKQPLPAGMQLVGPKASDFQLLHLARQWQRESGYRFQLPDYIRGQLA